MIRATNKICKWVYVAFGVQIFSCVVGNFRMTPPPRFFTSLEPPQHARILEDGILHCDKAGYQVLGKNGDDVWDRQGT